MTADDRFEHRLEERLREYAAPAARRPSRETVDDAVDGAGGLIGSGAVVRLRRGAGRNRDVRFLLLAAVLVLGVVGAGLLAGRFLEDERRPQATLPAVVLTSPGPSALVVKTPGPARATALTCASAVQHGPIRTIHVSRDPEVRWVAGRAPVGTPSNGPIAVGFRPVDALIPGVYLLEPAGGDPCLAVEHDLPTLGAVRWAPAGDALAIEAEQSNGAVENIFWSSIGATSLDGFFTQGRWSPDGGRVIVRTEILSADGSPARPLGCDGCLDSIRSLGLAWSPDGTQLAAGIPSPTSDGLSKIAVGSAATGHLTTFPSFIVDPIVIGWLDDSTLLVVGRTPPPDESGYNLFSVALDDPGRSVLIGDPLTENMTFSRDFRRVAWVERRPDATELRAVDLKDLTGYVDLSLARTVLDARSLGPGIDIGSFAWAPDGSRLAIEAVGVGDQLSRGLWTVAVDGSDLRQVTSLPVTLPPGDPWQPVWP